MSSWGKDLAFALRSLARRPALTMVAVAALGVGIGLNATIATLVTPMLIRLLPFVEPDYVVGVFGERAEGGTWLGSSTGDILDWRDQARSFTGIATYTRRSFNLGGGASLLAGVLPARRAIYVDPARTLRCE